MTADDIRKLADAHEALDNMKDALAFRALAHVMEAAKMAVTAELYDPQTGNIDTDVLYIVRSECRRAVNRVERLKP